MKGERTDGINMCLKIKFAKGFIIAELFEATKGIKNWEALIYIWAGVRAESHKSYALFKAFFHWILGTLSRGSTLRK